MFTKSDKIIIKNDSKFMHHAQAVESKRKLQDRSTRTHDACKSSENWEIILRCQEWVKK